MKTYCKFFDCYKLKCELIFCRCVSFAISELHSYFAAVDYVLVLNLVQMGNIAAGKTKIKMSNMLIEK